MTERLSETYRDYETRVENRNGCDFFVIVNPFGGENISIGDECGLIFFFAHHHAHFDYCEDDDVDAVIDSLTEYINEFMSGDKVSFQFFCDGKPVLGGDMRLSDIDTSDGESLMKIFTNNLSEVAAKIYKQLFDKMKGGNCRCEIHGWNKVSDKVVHFTP
jgi:hypothetical protein